MVRYNKDTLVQQTTVEYLERGLGWESVYAYNNEYFGPGIGSRGGVDPHPVEQA